MKAIVLGATGLTGSHLIDSLIEDAKCEEIRVFSRRAISQKHPKIKEFIIDLFELEKYSSDFTGDVVYCCIGTTKKKTPDPKIYERIDYGIPLSAAKLAKQNNIPKYLFISSLGANENSSVFYSKLKGKAEKDIINLELQEMYILRPSLIVGERNEKRLGENFASALMKGLDFLIPKKYKRIEAKTIAKAMHNLYYNCYDKIRIDSAEIKEIARREV